MNKLLIFISILGIGLSAQAERVNSTFIIPNPYKVDRGGHATGAAAAWNTQKLAGGNYSTTKEVEDFGGETTTDTNAFNVYTYQHYSPVTFEVSYRNENSEDDQTPKDENEDTELNLRAGAQLPGTTLAVGVDYGSSEDEDKTADTTDKFNDLALSTSYKLGDSLFLGAGYEQSEYKPDSGTKEKDDQFYLGAGWAKENMNTEAVLLFENEEGTKSYTLVGQGALNIGDNQVVGELIYLNSKNDLDDDKTTLVRLAGGYYFDLSGFYVQPELGYQTVEFSSAGLSADTSTVTVAVELGMKTDAFNLYLNIDRGQTDYDNGDGESTAFLLGGHAYF